MTTYLILGATPIGVAVARQLVNQPDTTVRYLHGATTQLPADLADQVTDLTGDLHKAVTYGPALQDRPVVFSALTGMDVDWAFEALFDTQYRQQLPLTRFVMLSTAGVDQEVTGDLEYPGITDVKEYLNQQRYAAKQVDEAEFPYTILRPVTLTDAPAATPKIIAEGQPVPAGTVSRETVARVAGELLLNGGHDYQSLAIC
ncbi:NAD(P)-binding oxidoreductase [Levilactobacillus zymae]|uniref:NAD-dependent dehydratase n=1 Tax=Levilactobacillus zymae TaxID=267363 RepID=A0A1Y6JZX4_9LACO|nr:NAD(P)-binding oxidoreductase [Levilactobacillus zymae]KRL12677.1 saccharopine dehydrogenase related protein [Levilactobacillus zymae DSM 19395]QFR61985.1 NAD(P)H-binding protein [Levilactobacillus zymae]GEO72393.1 NAD-dependent dehydratase [Levilactobacillus zymae]SMS15445.1 putative NADH-flavin reductase [Levilactobacillus zymae]